MAKAYRFKTGQEGIPDDQKIVEEYETLEVIENINIADAEQQISMMNNDIASITIRRDVLQARVTAAKTALGIS
jgi:hypothetical protein